MYRKPKAVEGVIIPTLDHENGELKVPTGEDWVMISGQALRIVYEHEAMVLGTGASVIWYNVGKAVGKTEGEKFAGTVDILGIEGLGKEVGKKYSQLGWGWIEIRSVDLLKNEITITVRNSPMVRGISDSVPRCWYARGFMEGIVSAILGVDATAFEVGCEAVNRDHCEFKVTWKMPSTPGSRA